MMAQSLYYRKSKLLEARDKFEEVINLFPESDFAKRAPIYIARCYYETNQEDKAYQKLRDFIVSGGSLKYLPEAMNLMAEYYLEEADYTQAEYYYQKIIDEYPNKLKINNTYVKTFFVYAYPNFLE
jgi:TolA-binding protein